MISQDIRRNFLQFFERNGHAIIPSSSVVPHDDPTLLFTNAGMNQFKDAFLGKSQRDYVRAATSQKCIRVGGKHNDLENVGHTTRHLTFFEMLGNFSFGDYFKSQAIAYAWQVTTEVFGFAPEKVWVTVFENDDEAYEYWKAFVPESRIVRMGEKDNFWAMGDTGPCGPCSELLYDRGERYGQARSPKEDATGERYLEFWNLVFMQFNRDITAAMTSLPKQSIDTGSGLERIVSLKMGVDNVFATDIFLALIHQIEKVTGKKYDASNPQLSAAYHVIADHIRSLSFAIADGAQPSNIERGYVLRKILRRAVRYGKMLDQTQPFLAKVLPALISNMGNDYPELITCQNRIEEILTLEEEAFIRTLKRGGGILQQVIEKAQQNPKKQISGEEAFKLKDTYGFPIEEVLLIAKDSGLDVHLESFQLLESEAKNKSRQAQTAHHQVAEVSLFQNFAQSHGRCEFTGYHDVEGEGTILALLHEGRFVDTLLEGQEGSVILSKTPFYAEKGGQVGDTGILVHDSAHFLVNSCSTPFTDIIIHSGKIDKGNLITGEPVRAFVDIARRKKIACNHTATHLLHYALEKILGGHIRQAGSVVDPERLRFDFSHHKSLSEDEIQSIERLINSKIRENHLIKDYELSYDEAQKRSDIKQFFGDKYGTKVRVVDIDFSKELCGGTHAENCGALGLFRIAKESSIAAGVRRIEAVTGEKAEDLMYEEKKSLEDVATLIKASPATLKEKLSSLLTENKELSQQLRALKKLQIVHLSKDLINQAEKVGSSLFINATLSLDNEEIQMLLDELCQRSKDVVAAITTKDTDRCQLYIRVGASAAGRGIHAGNIIKTVAPLIGGKGGGRADFAQAGGSITLGIEDALRAIKTAIESL